MDSAKLLDLLSAMVNVVAAQLAHEGRQTGKSPPAKEPAGRLFSPLERAIVDALAAGPLSAEQIAGKVGEAPSSRLRTILANLVEREALAVTKDGYKLTAMPPIAME